MGLDRATRQKIFAELAAPFDESCIERTKGAVTRKGYDTTGVKYQHVVDRLNAVLGVGGWRAEPIFEHFDVKTQSGRPMVETMCDLTLWLGEWSDGKFVAFAEATGTGGHVSATKADSKKGAFTNAFKKTAAFFGPGRQAYAGTLDDDSEPFYEPKEPPPYEIPRTPRPEALGPNAGWTREQKDKHNAEVKAHRDFATQPPLFEGNEAERLAKAKELIALLRKEHGDDFCRNAVKHARSDRAIDLEQKIREIWHAEASVALGAAFARHKIPLADAETWLAPWGGDERKASYQDLRDLVSRINEEMKE